MRALLGGKGELGLLVADNEASIGLLKKSQRHLLHRKRFVLLRILRCMTEDTLGGSKRDQILM